MRKRLRRHAETSRRKHYNASERNRMLPALSAQSAWPFTLLSKLRACVYVEPSRPQWHGAREWGLGQQGQGCRVEVNRDKGLACKGLRTEAAESTRAPGDDSPGAASKYRPVHTTTSPATHTEGGARGARKDRLLSSEEDRQESSEVDRPEDRPEGARQRGAREKSQKDREKPGARRIVCCYLSPSCYLSPCCYLSPSCYLFPCCYLSPTPAVSPNPRNSSTTTFCDPKTRLFPGI
jgi:hypothetical protein